MVGRYDDWETNGKREQKAHRENMRTSSNTIAIGIKERD